MNGHDDRPPHDVEPLDPALAEALQALPPSIEPTRDLWEAIDEALAPADAPSPRPAPGPSARPHRGLVLLLAAAAVLAASAGLLAQRPVAPGAPTVAVAPAPGPEADTAPSADRWASDLHRANQALLAQLAARRDLSPEARAAIDENLARIDAAINEVRLLLDEQPDDPELQRWLTDTEALKRRVLVSALRLPEGS